MAQSELKFPGCAVFINSQFIVVQTSNLYNEGNCSLLAQKGSVLIMTNCEIRKQERTQAIKALFIGAGVYSALPKWNSSNLLSALNAQKTLSSTLMENFTPHRSQFLTGDSVQTKPARFAGKCNCRTHKSRQSNRIKSRVQGGLNHVL